jgi:anti-sigma regulatory factor (Ser/Thr protein kinase)
MAPVFTYHHTVRLEDLVGVRRFLKEAMEHWDADEETVEGFVMAVNEGVTNILLHGYQAQTGIVEIEVQHSGNHFVVTLRDEAPLFDPTGCPAPDTRAPLEMRGSGGMGIHMMRHFTDSLQYQVTEDGRNELIFIKMEARDGNTN